MSNISTKQLEANRQKAKLGGVKTEKGKAISKYNAIKHGVLSKEVLMGNDDKNSFLEFGKKIRISLKPETAIEQILVDRIITNYWRLKRTVQIEREMIEKDRTYESFSGEKLERNLGDAFSIDFTNHDTYNKFIRYETSIERSIYKALHELQRIQSARRGEHPPVPLAIDIDVDGSK